MKKFLFTAAFLIIFIFIAISSVLADSYESTVSDGHVIVKKILENGQADIRSIDVESIDGIQYFGIRKMSDACDASVSWDGDTGSISVNSEGKNILFKSGSSEIYSNGTLYDYGIPVVIKDGTSYAPIEARGLFTDENVKDAAAPIAGDSTNLFEIQKGIGSDRLRVNAPFDKITDDFILKNPYRLVLDIKDAGDYGELPDGQTFNNIRVGYQNDGITRYVFDLNGSYDYSIYPDGSGFLVDISQNGTFVPEEDKIEYRNDSVILNTGDYEGYEITRSSDPFSIIIRIPTQIVNDKTTIEPKQSLIDKIEAVPDEGGTKITIVTGLQCAFELEKTENAFIMGIYEPVVKGVEYHNSDSVPYLKLEGKYQGKIDINEKSDGIYITVLDPGKEITPGQIYVNDGFIKSIYVTRSGNDASIKIEGRKKLYPANVVQDSDERIYLNTEDLSGKLVVISAGHGGKDPGAVAGDVHEADINLSIAKKLYANLLELGIDALMVRDDDTFYSLDERVRIANENNAALFISIHANSLDDPGFDGLMTLVHSGPLDYDNMNGRTAGNIMHPYLIEATGATDRGVRYRDRIVVLRDTAMPAVEIETGFLTNESELSKLLDDTYQSIIAEAMAKGITEVLKYID